MKIKKILVSQPKPDSDKSPFAEFSERNNVKVDFRPFIQVEGVSVKEFRKFRINILEYTSVIFTSRTAVDHFFRICEELRITVPDSFKYFCISESTAFYLQKYIVYRKRKIFFGNNKIEDLSEILLKNKNEKYLVPLSDIHQQEIPRKLTKLNLKYTKVILYRTVCADLSDLAEVDYDILVFYSPLGIQSLFKNFPDFKQNETRIASFGPSTAKAVKDAGLRLDIQAPMPKAPSMTMALEQYIQKVNKDDKVL